MLRLIKEPSSLSGSLYEVNKEPGHTAESPLDRDMGYEEIGRRELFTEELAAGLSMTGTLERSDESLRLFRYQI